jgi:general stress protein 26
MPSDSDIEARFWKALKASPFVMLGLAGARDGHAQPMTARTFHHQDHGPLWFFCARDNGIVTALGESHRAIATFAAKGHDLFASLHGELSLVIDRVAIEKLWDEDAAPWFEGGKSDPKLALLRLDTEKAEIWLGTSPTVGAITRILGHAKDPKERARDNVAEVAL